MSSVASLKADSHFTYVQRLVGSSFQNGKQAVSGGIVTSGALDTDTFSRNTVTQGLTYGSSGRLANGRRGSGEAMMSPEERAAWLKENPPKPVPYSKEWYAQKNAERTDKLNAEHADWSHHDAPELKYADYFDRFMLQRYEDSVAGKAPPLTDIESYTARAEYSIKAILEHEGITLKDDKTFYITSENGKKTISGLADTEKQKRIEQAINTSHIIDKDYNASVLGLDMLNFINTDWAKAGVDLIDSQLRAILTQQKPTAQQELKDLLGIEIDLSKIYLDENGKISGYPPEMEQRIGDGWNPNTRGDGIYLSQLGMQVHHTLELIGRYGFDNIPDMDESDIYLSYSNQEGIQVLKR